MEDAYDPPDVQEQEQAAWGGEPVQSQGDTSA